MNIAKQIMTIYMQNKKIKNIVDLIGRLGLNFEIP